MHLIGARIVTELSRRVVCEGSACLFGAVGHSEGILAFLVDEKPTETENQRQDVRVTDRRTHTRSGGYKSYTRTMRAIDECERRR